MIAMVTPRFCPNCGTQLPVVLSSIAQPPSKEIGKKRIGIRLVAIITICLIMGGLSGIGISYLMYQPQIQDLQEENDSLKSEYEEQLKTADTRYNLLLADFKETRDNLIEMSRKAESLEAENSKLRTEIGNLTSTTP